MARPRLIVAGNCQARFLAELLSGSPKVRDQYLVVYFRNFRKGDQSEIDEKSVRYCSVLLEQVAHQAAELQLKALLPKRTKVIRFPILWCNALWPTSVGDPRGRSDGKGSPPWPYGDRIVLDALDKGLSPSEAVARWFDADVPLMMDLDRFHEINVKKARDLDARSDVKFGSELLTKFRQQRLFVTPTHLSLPALEIIADRIFRALNLGDRDSDVEKAVRGMTSTHVPVQPSVARHFGLEWWSPELPARLDGASLTVAEYWRRYSIFDTPSGL